MKLEIRPAAPKEASVVSEILTEAAQWLHSLGQELWVPRQLTAEQVAPDCEAGFFFLAWSGTESVGTMRLTESDPLFWADARAGEAIYLHRLAVRRAAAGGLVSQSLLRHAGQVAVSRGASFLRLDCVSNWPRLRHFYESFGFTLHSYRTVRGVHVARYQLGNTPAANQDAAVD